MFCPQPDGSMAEGLYLPPPDCLRGFNQLVTTTRYYQEFCIGLGEHPEVSGLETGIQDQVPETVLPRDSGWKHLRQRL